jgi:hypothetical protein
MEDPRIISALFISLKMAYYNVLINTLYEADKTSRTCTPEKMLFIQ